VTLALADVVTCTINNTAIPPTLTLRKQVVNTSGGTAVNTDWLLTATGPSTITGRHGDAPITGAVVPGGTFPLSEAGGPTGYTASVWTCTGASSSNSGAGTVTLVPGNNAICTITNTDQPAKLTLTKVVDPAASGSGKHPTDWTLTAMPFGIPGQGP